MKYVRFDGETPCQGTYYEEYLAFEDDTPIEFIKMSSMNYALENAKKFSHLRSKNVTRNEWTQACISLGSYSFVSEEEFNEAVN